MSEGGAYDAEHAAQGPSAVAPSATYVELYKLAVEMADRVSARRTTANGFFLTAESALVALLGNESFDGQAVALAGILLATAWWLLLRSYRDLNRAKFTVITEMEAQLPAQIFAQEWETLKTDPIARWRQRYAELNWLERVVPVVFACVYVFSLLS